MTSLHLHFTLDTVHKRDHSLYFSWQYIPVDMVDNVPEDNHGILAWTVLFINIYSVYIIESEVAEFCTITHSPPSSLELLLSSQFHITGKMVSVIAMINLGSLT